MEVKWRRAIFAHFRQAPEIPAQKEGNKHGELSLSCIGIFRCLVVFQGILRYFIIYFE